MIIDLPRNNLGSNAPPGEKIAAMEQQIKVFRDQVEMFFSDSPGGTDQNYESINTEIVVLKQRISALSLLGNTNSSDIRALERKLAEIEGQIAQLQDRQDKHYTHTQSSASDTWTITHNLGKYPAVSVVDSAGTVVVGDVEYIDANTCILTFNGTFSGKAYLN